MNCHRRAARTFEYAAGLNDDSTCGRTASSAGSPRFASVSAMWVSQAPERISPARKRSAWPSWKRISSIAERSEEHTSELQSPCNLVCRLLLEKKKEHMHLDLIDHNPLKPLPVAGCGHITRQLVHP